MPMPALDDDLARDIRDEYENFGAELEGTFIVANIEAVMLVDEFGWTAFYRQGPHVVRIYSLTRQEVLAAARAMILANSAD